MVEKAPSLHWDSDAMSAKTAAISRTDVSKLEVSVEALSADADWEFPEGGYGWIVVLGVSSSFIRQRNVSDLGGAMLVRSDPFCDVSPIPYINLN